MVMLYTRPATEPQRFLPESFEHALRSGLSRSFGFILCAVAALGWLSLLTWTVTDPSPMHATAGQVRNLLGPFGAAISDLLLQMLGVAALAALLAPMLWGAELVVVRAVAHLRVKIFLLPIAVLMLAGGLSALPKPEGWPLRHGLGGFFGDTLLIVAAGVAGLLAPSRAPAIAGLVLFAAGVGLIAYCAGLSQRDIWTLMDARRRGHLPSGGRTSGPRPHGPSLATDSERGWSVSPTLSFNPIVAPDHRPLPDSGERTPAHVRMPVEQEAGPTVVARHVHYSEPDAAEIEDLGQEDHDPDDSVAILARRFAPEGVAPPEAPSLSDHDVNQSRSDPAKLSSVAEPAAVIPRPVIKDVQKRPGAAFPSLTLLKARPENFSPIAREVLTERAHQLEDVLGDFGVKGEIKDIRPGPVVTVFEFEPQRGTKSARVIGLADDIGRSMGVRTLRISIVPGRNALGIEVPNKTSETVLLREILETAQFRGTEGNLPIALGKSINGEPVVADLARMPHLLVAGTTGSGKSVGINGMILSLLYRHTPQRCRLLMIDPKMLELSVYNDIPHLLAPVVTDPMLAVGALNWAVGEMEERYKRMAKLGVRNVDGYNKRVREALASGERLERCVQTGFDPATGQAIYESETLPVEELPYIVIVVDEFADLMLVAGKEIEALVQRLAQMARAAGIHLIMATQRPSVDVITGTIKANFPSRISFKVASKIDSRTILNEQGAEQLLGHGDMLFLASSGTLQRVHGAFVTDEEVESIAKFLRTTGTPNYVHGVTEYMPRDQSTGTNMGHGGSPGGDLYTQALEIVVRDRKASTSYLQRRLSIGYNRAADLIDRLEANGVIGPQSSAGRRDVLLTSIDDLDRLL